MDRFIGNTAKEATVVFSDLKSNMDRFIAVGVPPSPSGALFKIQYG